MPAVLGALGLREAVLREALVARDGLGRLLDVLGDREAILVLDNCEHLIAGVAELADRLLGRLPEAAPGGHEPRGAGDLGREPGRGPAARARRPRRSCSPTAPRPRCPAS